MWREIKTSNPYKRVVEDDKTGKVRIIKLDQRHREAVRRGDTLQPRGKDEIEFFDKYRHLKKNSKGELVDKNLEKETIDAQNQNALEIEKEEFEKGGNIHKKYY